jgi:hypothetical protein
VAGFGLDPFGTSPFGGVAEGTAAGALTRTRSLTAAAAASGAVPGTTPGDVSAARTRGLIGQPATDCLLVVFQAPGGGPTLVRECPPDLSITSSAPGGYDSMTCTLDWPSGWPAPEQLTAAAVARVIDRRNGGTIWYGQVIDPGRKTTDSAGTHRVAARGFQTVLDTTGGAVAYVDRDMGRWRWAGDYKAASGTEVQDISLGAHAGDWVAATQSVLETSVPEGAAAKGTPRTVATWQYLPGRYSEAGQDILLILGTVGAASASTWRYQIAIRNQANTVTTTVLSELVSTATGSATDFTLFRGAGSWTPDEVRSINAILQWSSTANGTQPDDFWLRWGNLAVVYNTLNRFGVPTGEVSAEVPAWRLVNDVIGRWLRDDLEITQAIAQPTELVEHATWFEGTTPREVFDFVEDLDNSNYWAVWEPGVTGRPQFEYVPWATKPRYILNASNSTIELAGGGEDLFNRAVVTYQGSKEVATTVVQGYVRELTAAGQERTLMVDLTGDGQMSLSVAQARGLRALTRANDDKATGAATITGPVFDAKLNRMIEPWEVRAGWNIVAGQGVLRADGGYVYDTAGGKRGATYRVTDAQFDAASNTCRLTLDGGTRSLFSRVRIRPPSKKKRHVKPKAPGKVSRYDP